MVGRVYNGVEWEDVITTEDNPITSSTQEHDVYKIVKPIISKDNIHQNSIFVNLASFRDGERCGKTIKSIYDQASNPDGVFVGLVEQNAPKDKECLVEYCSLYDTKIDMKTFQNRDLHCPHIHQIRYLAIHHLAAAGPSYARSLSRKILGNETFCLQIDSHTTTFIPHWDEALVGEWTDIDNEYGILSTVPAATTTTTNTGKEEEREVPRQCKVTFHEGNMIPMFVSPADGKAKDLERPLLSHGWSAAFSFAKCHLEEAAPYDNFAPQLFDAEQFPRFARFWTRGYDVYTPTKNIVYHDYNANPEGHDPKGWTKDEPVRIQALSRMKTLLSSERSPSSSADGAAAANLGVYGLGKRRTLEQLIKFVGVDLEVGSGNDGTKCTNDQWVPYDTSISPLENMYNNPDDLDPQPEFPLRSLTLSTNQIPSANNNKWQKRFLMGEDEMGDDKTSPFNTILTLWCFGLFVWYMVFVAKTDTTATVGEKRGIGSRRKKKKSLLGDKDM